MRRSLRWPVIAAAVLLWFWLPALMPGRETVLVLLTLSVPVVVGIVLLAGYTGQVSVGQAAFFGLGAYGTGILSVHVGLDPWLAMPSAVAATAAVAWVIGTPVLMLRGQYVVLATLGFNVIFVVLATQLDSLTGGASGLIGIRPLQIGDTALIGNDYFYFAGSALALGSVLLSRRLVRSRIGRALQAIEGSEVAASALGVNRRRYATQIFVWSAALAAASGALYAEWVRFISPSSFSIDVSIEFLIMAAIGGIASIGGAVAGTALFLTAREVLREVLPWFGGTSGGSAEYELIAFGLVLALTVIFLPGGVWPWIRGVAGQRLGRVRPQDPASGVSTIAAAAPTVERAVSRASDEPDQPALSVDGLTQRFGGVTALNDISVTVEPGMILGVIGPNGAGKSTFLNAVSGVIRPTAGRIAVNGVVVTGRPPHRIAEAGVSRTFQTPRLFPLLDVVDNVRVGLHRRLEAGFLRSALGLSRLEERRAEQQANAALHTMGLGWIGHVGVDTLPFGQMRLVELARALAGRPQLLLLDEPASGLAADERGELKKLVRRIRDAGTTVVLVEHDVPLVMDLADRIVVLHHGVKLAQGTPEAIAADDEVITAYLGASTAVDRRSERVARRDAPASPLLDVEGLSAGYGRVRVLHDVSLHVCGGELVGLLGPNGAGKSTMTRALMGLLPSHGRRVLDRSSLSELTPERVVAAGLSLVPEGRELLPTMTVDDHLRLGAYVARRRSRPRAEIDAVVELFPVLGEKRHHAAGALSGGQQQQLAIARALMSRPKLLVLDEPLLGLAPLVVRDILEAITRLAADGVSVLLVEQNAASVLPILDRVYVLENGRVASTGTAAELEGTAALQGTFLGAFAAGPTTPPGEHLVG
jgi:ABC-type branched-subunit amino acid transport system ATPase component/ABC-type branched-subunit amino acid transport system permease subunit